MHSNSWLVSCRVPTYIPTGSREIGCFQWSQKCRISFVCYISSGSPTAAGAHNDLCLAGVWHLQKDRFIATWSQCKSPMHIRCNMEATEDRCVLHTGVTSGRGVFQSSLSFHCTSISGLEWNLATGLTTLHFSEISPRPSNVSLKVLSAFSCRGPKSHCFVSVIHSHISCDQHRNNCSLTNWWFSIVVESKQP